MSETGSVKFSYELLETELARFVGFDELNACRRRLQQLRLLGVDESGIGFGNVSVREGETNYFFITGSGTGRLPTLTLRDCARVTAVQFECNWLRCEGLVVASAESLTHAAVYFADEEAKAVIHAHSDELWTELCRAGATTSRAIEYGTPAMADEVERLFRESDVRHRKIFAMGGHEHGVVAFGATLPDAFSALLSCSS